MKYEEITTEDTLNAEDIYKLLCDGIRKYEKECGFSPSKIIISGRAFHILEVDMGKEIRDKPSLTFCGIDCEVKPLRDGQVALILR